VSRTVVSARVTRCKYRDYISELKNPQEGSCLTVNGKGWTMSDETQNDQDVTDDSASAEQGEFRRPWFLSGDEKLSEKHSYESKDESHDWRTAAQVADSAEHEDSREEDPDDSPQPNESADVADSPDTSQEEDLPVVHDKAAASSGLAFPEGLIDLTEETEDSVRIPASAYRGETTEEPVHGTVEVDRPVNQPNETVIMPVEADDRRAARARALGEVDPGADVIAAPALLTPPETYKGWPSFALFIFRLIIATILSIRATQELLNFTATKDAWTNSVLPNPEVLAICQIIVEYLIALMLLLGLASRVAGVLLMVLYIMVLSFLRWGAVNPFQSGVIGFTGEYEVLMVVIGLAFAGIGGGSAAVDGAVHKARLERKNAKLGGVRPEED